MLDSLYQATFWQLSERLSEFMPLLPDDDDDVGARTRRWRIGARASCTALCRRSTSRR